MRILILIASLAATLAFGIAHAQQQCRTSCVSNGGSGARSSSSTCYTYCS